MRGNDNFILFNHAYTSRCQTVPALERALTEKNQYNDKEFNQSVTVIDIAKKAGYETYWFSNQGYISDADTPITLVAKTADHAEWLSEDKNLKGKYQYDGDLLNCLKKVDPTKTTLLFCILWAVMRIVLTVIRKASPNSASRVNLIWY